MTGVGTIRQEIGGSGGSCVFGVRMTRYTQVNTVICARCGRSFRRESDKARHKCIVERELPIEEHFGAVQCQKCECCFRSKGGLAVHRCGVSEQSTRAVSGQAISCSVCNRTFSRSGNLKRHKC